MVAGLRETEIVPRFGMISNDEGILGGALADDPCAPNEKMRSATQRLILNFIRIKKKTVQES